MLFRPEGSEWIWRESWERLLLEGELSPILVTNMGRSLALQVRLLPVIPAFERVIDKTLYGLQLNVRLCSGHDLTHPCDAMLQHVFV